MFGFSNKEPICPDIGKPCIKHGCTRYIKITGIDSNTGKEVDQHDCVINTIPMLLIENSNQQRATGAAVESFRNEMVKSNEMSQSLLIATQHK